MGDSTIEEARSLRPCCIMGDSTIDNNTDQSSQLPVKTNGGLGRSAHQSIIRIFQNGILGFDRPFKRLPQREGDVSHHESLQPTQNISRIQSGPRPAYARPQMVSLGPFHQLSQQTLKSKLLSKEEGIHFEQLVESMKRDQRRIRQWYVDSQCPSSDEDLAQMMARDGLFLLQFLREISRRPEYDASRFTHPFHKIMLLSIFSQRFAAVQEDVMRIGNQIPMFVLKSILQFEASTYHLEAGTVQDLDSILIDAWVYLSPIQYRCDSQDSHVKARAGGKVRDDWHLLEYVYENIIRPSDFAGRNKRRKKKRGDSRIAPYPTSNRITLPSAVQLRAKGVEFDQGEGPLDKIRFDGRKRTLYLPAIEMNGRTDVVLRNLVTFEADSRREKQPLMRYVDMMERLIDKAEDVEVLRNSGIIRSHLGTDDDVAAVWNGMRKGVLLAENIEYAPIDNAVHDVITFYTSKHKVMYTEFKRKYCSKPWMVISVISACILLLLTVLQTLLSWEQVRLQLKGMNCTV